MSNLDAIDAHAREMGEKRSAALREIRERLVPVEGLIEEYAAGDPVRPAMFVRDAYRELLGEIDEAEDYEETDVM